MVVAAVTKTLVILVIALAFVPLTATAQEKTEAVDSVTTDRNDDVMIRAGSAPPQSATSTGQADPLDIQSVTVGFETEKDFRVVLQTKALPSGQGPGPTRIVSFEFEGVLYRVGLGIVRQGGGGPGQGGGNQQGALQSFDDGGNRYRTVASVPTQVDAGSHTVSFTIPRGEIVDKDHVPIRFADSITNIFAMTAQTYASAAFLPGGNDPTGGAQMYDRAPDDGFGAPYTFAKGKLSAGGLELSALEPIRVSNGEATTIVYKVDARNLDSADHTYQFEVRDAPPDWSIRIPQFTTVGAGKASTFPVIVSLPFTHKHGETATFQLRAQDVQDSQAWSVVNLGVFWTQTPQPAGHHPQMWLHSAPADNSFDPSGAFTTAYAFRTAWINALEDEIEAGADDANVPAYFNEELTNSGFGQRQPPSGQQWTAEWFFPMSPALLIGVDLDPAALGKLSVKVYHDVPAQQTKLIARFLYCDPERGAAGGGMGGGGGGGGNCSTGQISNKWFPIAQGESPTTSASAQETVGFEFPLAVLPDGDLQPYKHGANIGLELKLVTNVPSNAMVPRPHPEVVLKSGGGRSVLALPLIEYHDPIEQAFKSLGNLQIKALTPEEKKANPGRTAVYHFEVTNAGTEADEVGLEIHGENTLWARAVGEQRFGLKPHETRKVDLAVSVPTAEHAGNRAELFLVAQSQKDVASVAAIRLRTTVVEGEDVPDEAGQVSQVAHKSTPSGDGLVALVAVAAIAWTGRRRP